MDFNIDVKDILKRRLLKPIYINFIKLINIIINLDHI